MRRHHILDYYREVVESGSLDLDEYRAFVTGELLASSRMWLRSLVSSSTRGPQTWL